MFFHCVFTNAMSFLLHNVEYEIDELFLEGFNRFHKAFHSIRVDVWIQAVPQISNITTLAKTLKHLFGGFLYFQIGAIQSTRV